MRGPGDSSPSPWQSQRGLVARPSRTGAGELAPPSEGRPHRRLAVRLPSLGRVVGWLSTSAGLATLFAAGLVLRLVIVPHVGFYGDLRWFGIWSRRLAEVGPRHFYAPDVFSDYPPGYLYVLWVVGKIGRAIGHPTPGYYLLKAPAILGDLGLAWVVGELAVRLTPPSAARGIPVRAAGAAAVLFNPAVFGLGAVWGQVDVIPALLVVSALLFVFTGEHRLRRDIGGTVLFALAVSMKPQSAVVLPAIVLGLAWRRLNRGWTRRNAISSLARIAVVGVLSFAAWTLTGLPFGLGPLATLRFYRHAASVYPVTSVWAFNLWGAVGFWRYDVAEQPTWVPRRVLGVPALYVGLFLFAVGTALILWRAYRSLRRGEHEGRVLVFAAAASSLLGYTVLTRMHERYLFLSLACLVPLVLYRGVRRAYALLSGLFIVNLWFPYVLFNQQWLDSPYPVSPRTLRIEPIYTWLYGNTAVTDTAQKRLLSLATAAVCLWVAARGWRWVRSPEARVRLESLRVPAMRTQIAGVVTSLRSRVGTLIPTREPSVEPEPSVEREPVPAPQPARRWERVLPPAIVGAAVLFNLVVLRAETGAAHNLNDSAFHLQMVRWAAHQIDARRVPLDGWYPNLQLGSPLFHHYQSLPHTLTAYLGRVFGVETAYRWSLYLLLALWPLAVWWSARLFGWSRWTAAAAAAVSSLIVSAPGYGFEHGSYTWQGWGVWSQLWAMWLLPLAWALSWRAMALRRSYALAALALALTVACHFIAGYLAFVTIALWVVLSRGVVRRAGRAVVVGAGALLVGAWVIVPLVMDRQWSLRSVFYRGTLYADSYGARKVLGWLFTGRLFDDGRLPIITLLVAAGVLVCVLRWRRDERARALLGVFGLSLVLFFGRPTVGPLFRLLPGSGDLQIHRFVMGVHMAGILLAGVGAGWLGSLLLARARRLVPAVRPLAAALAVTAVGALVLLPAWKERASYDSRGATLLALQQYADARDVADLDALIDEAKARGGGRIYAGLRANWGKGYRVGYVPVYAEIANRDADGVGFTFRAVTSLSNDVEAVFDETNPADYDLFDVRYLILPEDRKPPVAATLLDRRGRHTLWTVPTSGYLEMVDTTTPVWADRTNLVTQVSDFLHSSLPAQHLHPTVAFAGRDAAEPTVAPGQRVAGSPGRIDQEYDALLDGAVGGRVFAARPAMVMLKVTFDPRWRVVVDGRTFPGQMVAPSFVGITLPPGPHTVLFEYVSYPWYPLLFVIGVLALLALWLVPRRWTGPAVRDAGPDSGIGVMTGALRALGRLKDQGVRRASALRTRTSASTLADADPGAGPGTKSEADRTSDARGRESEVRVPLDARGRLDFLRGPAILYVVAGGIALAAFVWRLWLLRVRFFDPDELAVLHSSWNVAHGLLPARDYYEIHPPWLYFVLAQFFRLFRADTQGAGAVSVMLLARRLMWVFTGLILLGTFQLGRRWRDARAGAVGAALLATVYVFQLKSLEIRPEVPAAALLLASLVVAVGPSEGRTWIRSPRARMMLSGALLGWAIFVAQKTVFALPGFGLALLLSARRSDGEDRRGRWRGVITWAVGFAIPITLTCGYFLGRGSLGDLLRGMWLTPLRWQVRYSPMLFIRSLTMENPVFVLLGAIGIFRTMVTVVRRRATGGSELLVLTTLSLMAGLFVSSVTFFQYYLLLLPLLALFAASALLDASDRALRLVRDGDDHPRAAALVVVTGVALSLAMWIPLRADWQRHPTTFLFLPVRTGLLSSVEAVAALAACALVLVLAARVRASRSVAVAVVLTLLTVVPLYREMTWGGFDNQAQRARVEYVIENTRPSDEVLDGFSGAGAFRPQAFYYGILPPDVRAIVPEQERLTLLDGLRTGTFAPRIIVLDGDLQQFLGPDVVGAIQKRYVPANVQPIWTLPPALRGRTPVAGPLKLYPWYRDLLTLGVLGLLGLWLGWRRRAVPATSSGPRMLTSGARRVGTVLTHSVVRPVRGAARPNVRRWLDAVPSAAPLYLVAGAIVLTELVWLGRLLHLRRFDPDELAVLHSSWNVAHHLLPYRDYYEVHPPWLYFFLSRIFRFFRADTDAASAASLMFFARRLMWVFSGVTLVETFYLGRRWRDARVGAVGAALLATTYFFRLKSFEVRPEVPAAAILLGSLLVAVGAEPESKVWIRSLQIRLFLSGALLGSAILVAQKAVFAAPGIAVALVWGFRRGGEADGHGARRRLTAWAAGVALPVAMTGAYFLARGALDDLVRGILLTPLKWRVRYPTSWFLRSLVQENPMIVALGVIGGLLVLRGLARRRSVGRGGALLALTALSLIAGLFVSVITFYQYFLLFLPLVALFAASTLVDVSDRAVARVHARRVPGGAALVLVAGGGLAFAAWMPLHRVWQRDTGQFVPLPVRTGSVSALEAVAAFIAVGAVLVLAARVGAPRTVALAAALVILTVVPLYRQIAWDHDDNQHQLALIAYVIENTRPSDTVLDGLTGAGVFRPQAFYYGTLFEDVRPLVPEKQRAALFERLRTGASAPRIIVLDADLEKFLRPNVLDAIQRYVPTGVRPLWKPA